MSKKFLFGFILGLAAVAAATLWLLSVLVPDSFGWFSLSWAVALVTGVFGVAFVIRGLFGKSAIPLKKFYIYFGAGFLIVAFLCLINEVTSIKSEVVLPVIALVVAVALLLGFVAVGGKKWDGGDNEKAGYKNYYQRKAEEEKKNKEDGE